MQTKPHFTYWIVAGLGLLWNLGGCLNYVTQTNPEAVAQMPEVYQLIITGRPGWATAAFAVGVFGGAVGCILLLMRHRAAPAILTVSVLGCLGTLYFVWRVVGFEPATVMAVLVAIALMWYATIVQRKGWLR